MEFLPKLFYLIFFFWLYVSYNFGLLFLFHIIIDIKASYQETMFYYYFKIFLSKFISRLYLTVATLSLINLTGFETLNDSLKYLVPKYLSFLINYLDSIYFFLTIECRALDLLVFYLFNLNIFFLPLSVLLFLNSGVWLEIKYWFSFLKSIGPHSNDWKASVEAGNRRQDSLNDFTKQSEEIKEYMRKTGMEFPDDGYIRPIILKVLEILKLQYDKFSDFDLMKSLKFQIFHNLDIWWLKIVETMASTTFKKFLWGYVWFSISVDALHDLYTGTKVYTSFFLNLLKNLLPVYLKLPAIQFTISFSGFVSWAFACIYMTYCTKHGLTGETLEAVRLSHELWPEARIIEPSFFEVSPSDPNYNAVIHLVEILDQVAGRTPETINVTGVNAANADRAEQMNDLNAKEMLARKEFKEDAAKTAEVIASVVVVVGIVIYIYSKL